jgi:enolase-phosphatase E1
MSFQAALLDIEGTTAPISFVYETLFPYARQHGPALIRELWNQPALSQARIDFERENVGDVVAGAPVVGAGSPDQDAVIAYYLWLINRDRKSTPLKLIQGLVWERGFEGGGLRSRVFADVPRALARWKRSGRHVAIYSSGSVLAQKLLFGYSEVGDLTPLIDAFFDTTVGHKRQLSSYETIARELALQMNEILFASDVVEELDAASAAGLQTALCLRPGNAPVQQEHRHLAIRSFDELP